MPRQKYVCGCSTSAWAKAIAGLQMAGSLLIIILCGIGLFRLDKILQIVNVKYPSRDEAKRREMLEIFGIFYIVQALICFTFAAILLAGAINRKAPLLNAWLIFSFVLLVIDIVGTILEDHYVGLTNPQTIVQSILSTAVRIVGIWIVWILRNEIQAGIRAQSSTAVEDEDHMEYYEKVKVVSPV